MAVTTTIDTKMDPKTAPLCELGMITLSERLRALKEAMFTAPSEGLRSTSSTRYGVLGGDCLRRHRTPQG